MVRIYIIKKVPIIYSNASPTQYKKKESLCKPFTVCTMDGFIVDVAGPFPAIKNDAQILQNLLFIENGLKCILRRGDISILDRGFRDVKELLEEMGYIVYMPALKGKSKQLSTEDSNQSRFVTKIRWVVEAVHGVIGQKYKLLHNQFHNSLLPEVNSYCQIACLLVNLFGKRLNSDKGLLEEIINRMSSTNDNINSLAEEVESNNWNRKTVPFQTMSSKEILDFPKMTLDDLKIFFTGTYQLSQAVSYLAELLEEDGSFQVNMLKINPQIVRFEVRSRHINSKTYKSYIHYDKYSVGIQGIKGYCCNCANGNRTVGCCSHLAAIIYNLSYGRYLSRIIRPAEMLSTLFDFEGVS